MCFRTVHEAYGFPPRNSNGFNPLAQDYYGIKGLRRVSNLWIVLFCVFFTAIGVGVQALAIRYIIEMFVLLASQLYNRPFKTIGYWATIYYILMY